MKLKYLAHAAFLITSDENIKILTDPYEPGGYDGAIGYQPINEAVDIITVSHNHADHDYIAPHHKNSKIVRRPGEYRHEDIQIIGFPTFHDENAGRERGENIIFIINIDGISILHLGDLGHMLSEDELTKIGNIDVLLIPVGGLFTIDADVANQVRLAIKPKICIPMHYKTKKLAFDLAPVDNFIKKAKEVKIIQCSEIELNKSMLSDINEVWILNMAKY